MDKIRILWADDEIDSLKPHLFFLEKKGYELTTVTNGHDALQVYQDDSTFDVVFLDESMPGLTGLETLSRIKTVNPRQSVVMITKNEAENLMEEAIGSQIDDYLIKPVNPNQIVLSLKKILDNRRLVAEKSVQNYQMAFRQISMDINSGLDLEGWIDIYKQIIGWELRMESADTAQMEEILNMQKSEANKEFSKFVIKNYASWFEQSSESPVLSHQLLREKVFTAWDQSKPAVVLLLDNLRYDQWKILEPIILENYNVENEDHFISMLPTATQYSRNAIFSGMTPDEISKRMPEYWRHDFEEGGKNMFEKELITQLVARTFSESKKVDYIKVTNVQAAKNLQNNILNYLNNDLTFIVYNFIDMLSHARTEMEVLKELAGDEKAYRSLTRSWFKNSPIWDAMQKLSEREVEVFILTDHGTIRVNTPSKVVADRDTTTNLRYKMGRNLNFDSKDVLHIKKPESVGLPAPHVSTSYIFGKEDIFFLYPNNYNYYHNYFKDTFQHGGISMEEMICPVVKLKPK